MGPGSPCVPIPRLGLICHKPWGGRQNTPRGRGSERGPACLPVLRRLGPAGQAPASGSNGSTWALPWCRDRVLGAAGPAQGARSRNAACAALLGAHGRAGQQLGLWGPESVCSRASQLGRPPHADPGLAGVWGADFRALVPGTGSVPAVLGWQLQAISSRPRACGSGLPCGQHPAGISGPAQAGTVCPLCPGDPRPRALNVESVLPAKATRP